MRLWPKDADSHGPLWLTAEQFGQGMLYQSCPNMESRFEDSRALNTGDGTLLDRN